jgi:Fe-S-cluster-containing hydrogenase component 2
MAHKDMYEDLVEEYEFFLGSIRNREAFKLALQERLSERDMQIVMLAPAHKVIALAEFERKCERAGISRDSIYDAMRRLIPEGFLVSYIELNEDGEVAYPLGRNKPLEILQHERRVVRRGDLLVMGELQVRKQEGDALRQETAEWFNVLLEDAGRSISQKTPPFRVIAAEPAVRAEPAYGRRKIEINEDIPDPREILPLDIVSEMVKKEPVIAVADCYCRRTKHILGEPCDHPMETCLYFNELALLQIETGRARRIDYDEALRILQESEDAGLVHNISNCEGQISTLCNCCTCSCGVMKSILLGGGNASGPSRFVVHYDAESCTGCEACVEICPIRVISTNDSKVTIDSERCIGCGWCVLNCPSGSISMVLRDDLPKVYRNGAVLRRRNMREAILGLMKRKVKEKLQSLPRPFR